MDTAENSHRIGAASLLQLRYAERACAATQTDYLDAVFAARSSFNVLERAIGMDPNPD